MTARDGDFTERADAFLADLRRITTKHQICISGCGCCGSPWLTRLTKHDAKKLKNRYAFNDDFQDLRWE